MNFFLLYVIIVSTQLSVSVGHKVNSTEENAATSTTLDAYQKSEEETNSDIEPRKKGDKDKDMMSRILPMMIIPFMISTAIIPMILTSLKFMLIKSAFIGKMAVILLIVNMLRSRSSGQGGVSTHNIHLQEKMSMAHYGYSGDEEYGAYIHQRRGFR